MFTFREVDNPVMHFIFLAGSNYNTFHDVGVQTLQITGTISPRVTPRSLVNVCDCLCLQCLVRGPQVRVGYSTTMDCLVDFYDGQLGVPSCPTHTSHSRNSEHFHNVADAIHGGTGGIFS